MIHDGVDTDAVAPDSEAFVQFPKKELRLTRKDEVITYVSRNLEPYRGFHIFMRALPELMKARPKAHFIVVGGNDVSYGSRLPKGTYREKYLAEIEGRYDPSRLHFVGKLPYSTFLRVLQVSTAHIYLTYPFVLSWSMMEAMAAGCLVIGSRTPPVEEVIEDGKNGLLVDFFSADQLINAINRVCEEPDRMQAIRDQARRTITERYDLRKVCLPRQKEIIGNSGLISLAGERLAV
ncbi:glycosyltransferase [Dyella flava]|uniref:glycosyltransferase n=1 Tax=Dyella flava TaxID=1920170 RepID=UPI003CCCD76E